MPTLQDIQNLFKPNPLAPANPWAPPKPPPNPYLGDFQKPFGTQEEVDAGIAKFLHHPGDNAQRAGLFGRVGHVVSKGAHDLWKGFTGRGARTHLWPIAAAAVGGGLATGAIGGGAGASSAAGGSAAASAFDPFAAGSAAFPEIAATGGAAVPVLAGGAGGGFYTPAGTWVSGVPAGDFGAMAAPAAASGSWASTPWGQALIKGGLGFASNKLLGGATSEEKNLTSSYGDLQKFLPPELANFDLNKGLQGIADLIANPGDLSPGVADAIRSRLAAESQNIAQSYRGLASNQAGAAARGNLPTSLKVALQSALDIAQERAQRGARQEALGQSEQLRRQDLEQTFSVLSAILQFMQSGRGGLQEAAQLSAQRRAATLALIGSLLSSIGTSRSGA